MGGSDPLSESVHATSGAAAAAVVWRYGDGLHVTVIAKATFAFAHDAEMKRAQPQAILRADVHHAKNPARSVRFTTDLALYLPRVDVLFTGHAHVIGPSVRTQPSRLVLFRDDETVFDKMVLVRDPRGF